MAKRILIIEDDTDILELLIYIFEEEGYHVSSFTKSLEAEQIVLLSPDVVLMDINLSGSPKRGDEICSDLRKFEFSRQIPVLLLSAEKNLASLALNCQADEYMTKPFDIDKLIENVENMQNVP